MGTNRRWRSGTGATDPSSLPAGTGSGPTGADGYDPSPCRPHWWAVTGGREFPDQTIIADGQIHTSATYERLLLAIKERQIPFSLARRGQVYELGGGALLTVLHPQELLYDDLNNNSVVLRLDFGEVAFLFTGYAETPAEL